MKTIRKVAVLGAGTMGSRIAAHFANAGIPALLLDIVIPGQPNRNSAAMKGLENAAKMKPGGFFTDDAAKIVKTGNFEDNLNEIASCDWIIEAVTENLEIKRALWTKVEALRKPDSIISTNTSGIPLKLISETFSAATRKHFLGTHFFNPPDRRMEIRRSYCSEDRLGPRPGPTQPNRRRTATDTVSGVNRV